MFELLLVDILLIQRDIQLALNLSARTLCVPQKPCKLDMTACIKPLRNIVHGRSSRSLDLVLQSPILRETVLTRKSINYLGQFPRHLPTFDFLESCDGGHGFLCFARALCCARAWCLVLSA